MAIAEQASLDFEVLKGEAVWVPINKIIPNPLNPRKNVEIRSTELQQIINFRGWEEPLTAYVKGSNFVLLAGHRRLFAAQAAKTVKEIPLFIVDKPINEQEELDRIASLQSGRVDWSPYEWGRYVFDRWKAWGKPAVNKLAKEMQVNPTTAKQYVDVLAYYPLHEIEDGLQNGSLTFSSLYTLITWIRNLKIHKGVLVEELGEDMIRRVLVEKIARKIVNRDNLRYKNYCKYATSDEIKMFLFNRDARIAERISQIVVETRYQNFTGHMISLSSVKKRIPNIIPESYEQKVSAIAQLKELQALISEQLGKLDDTNG